VIVTSTTTTTTEQPMTTAKPPETDKKPCAPGWAAGMAKNESESIFAKGKKMLYVDGDTGNDCNDGSACKPFKTRRAAEEFSMHFRLKNDGNITEFDEWVNPYCTDPAVLKKSLSPFTRGLGKTLERRAKKMAAAKSLFAKGRATVEKSRAAKRASFSRALGVGMQKKAKRDALRPPEHVYVDAKSGNDCNTGTTEGSPLRTREAAMALVAYVESSNNSTFDPAAFDNPVCVKQVTRKVMMRILHLKVDGGGSGSSGGGSSGSGSSGGSSGGSSSSSGEQRNCCQQRSGVGRSGD
jgi:hypothetical protein